MAKTFYEVLKEMLSGDLIGEVTQKMQGILSALNNVMTQESIKGYIAMFMGLAGALIVIGFFIELYNQASKDMISLQKLFVMFIKLFISVGIIVFLPQLVNGTFKLSLGLYGLVEQKVVQSQPDLEMHLYGVKIGFDTGVTPPSEKEQKSTSQKKDELDQNKTKTIYFFEGNGQESSGKEGQSTRVFETEEGLWDTYGKDKIYRYNSYQEMVAAGSVSTDQNMSASNITLGRYCPTTKEELDKVMSEAGLSASSIIDYDVVTKDESGKKEALTGKEETVYKSNGEKVDIGTGEAKDDILDADGFPSYEHCLAKKGTTDDGDEKSIKEAMEDTFGSNWISAATKGTFSLTTLVISVVFSLLNKIISLVIFVFAISNSVILMAQVIYSPLSIIQVFADNASAVGYLKKIAATCLNFVTIIVVLWGVDLLQGGIVKSIIGNVYLTSDNIEDVMNHCLVFLVCRIAAVVAILGGAKISNDVVGR